MKKIILGLFATVLSLGATAQSALTKKETKTLIKTYEIAMLTVKIGELAPSHAMAAETKATAQRLVEDYKQVQQQVEGLASKKNVALPTAISEKGMKILSWFEKKQGKDYDKAYLKGATKVNKGGRCKIKKLNKRTDDADLKDWSGKMLSTLEMHKTLLKQTCEAVKKMK
jgi:putative membrane protein